MQRCRTCFIDKDRCDCKEENKQDEIKEIVREMERLEKKRQELYRRYITIIKDRGGVL